MTTVGRRWPAVAVGFALPVGATLLLVLGASAAAVHPALSPSAVALVGGLIAAGVAAVAQPADAVPVAVIAWATAAAFGRAPYGELRPVGSMSAAAALVVGAGAFLGLVTGQAARRALNRPNTRTLNIVTDAVRRSHSLGWRRRLIALVVAAALLPSLTVLLTAERRALSLADELLAYLITVVLVAVIGGLGPAITAAIASSLLLNWFFTQPFHTLTIAAPDNLLSLVLFIVVAISVASVVHLAARRAQEAARSKAESESLLCLARMVLGGEDTPSAVLEHLQRTAGVGVVLWERSAVRWVTVAAAGPVEAPASTRLPIRPDLALTVHGAAAGDEVDRLVQAVAGQAAAALDRDRLRTQAAQAEALAAGNRMRTALLAAVSHDLRTPLSSLKASVSSLRQTDVAWSDADREALLENIEESTDRLAELIANLLDMSRLQAGALQPYLRPTSVDEVVPMALRGLPGARDVVLELPDTLPLVLTDAGLLERALANLLSNAIRHSPGDRPPHIAAREREARVELLVVDHGGGVPAADRDRIFEPFQRLGDQSPSSGIGLGLAVARGFVDSMGGELHAEDTPGGGLTMVVRLPASTRPAVVDSLER